MLLVDWVLASILYRLPDAVNNIHNFVRIIQMAQVICVIFLKEKRNIARVNYVAVLGVNEFMPTLDQNRLVHVRHRAKRPQRGLDLHVLGQNF